LRLLAVGNYLFEGVRHYIDVDFVCEAPQGEPARCEPEKCEGWDWYDLDRLPEPLFIVTRRMIESYRSGAMLSRVSEVESEERHRD